MYGARKVIQIFGTPKCKVTRAAQRFYADRKIKVMFVDLREKGLSKGELANVAKAVGGVRALFDAASPRVLERGLQHAGIDVPGPSSEERLAALLLEDPLLLKTPIVRDGALAAVGDAPDFWKRLAEKAKAG